MDQATPHVASLGGCPDSWPGNRIGSRILHTTRETAVAVLEPRAGSMSRWRATAVTR
jgi:hypothetical protein